MNSLSFVSFNLQKDFVRVRLLLRLGNRRLFNDSAERDQVRRWNGGVLAARELDTGGPEEIMGYSPDETRVDL
ncbi:hypothetical protein NDU88_002995 [Pleurodeles waltl]|uniref:Uncharacterized protein n=1 Tax=Pleurodeles waltl TaxID=8319 RepID=A0AAV7T3Q1_PLEWA|nr:hypothetical protein NDU88_002995 [Pleurodeles waltl]